MQAHPEKVHAYGVSNNTNRFDSEFVGEVMQDQVVLLVEDEALVAVDVQAMLEAAGYTVLGPAADVRSALALLASVRPDVAVLDIVLTDGDCRPIAEALDQARIPFVFLSGHPPEVTGRVELFQRPALSKPVDETALLTTLRRTLVTHTPG